jgi:hypothetical protein
MFDITEIKQIHISPDTQLVGLSPPKLKDRQVEFKNFRFAAVVRDDRVVGYRVTDLKGAPMESVELDIASPKKEPSGRKEEKHGAQPAMVCVCTPIGDGTMLCVCK